MEISIAGKSPCCNADLKFGPYVTVVCCTKCGKGFYMEPKMVSIVTTKEDK